MKRTLSVGVVALLAALFATLLTSGQTSAHGGRHVAEKYHFTVGFLDEPAYSGLKNALDLTICNGEECQYTVKDGLRVASNPVEKADQTLKAEVSSGSSAPLPLTLEPRFNNPGKYAAYFMPSKDGAYTFRIYGTLNGDKIDEKFTSGKDDFSEVDTIKTYPATSNQEEKTAALQNQVKAAEDRANNAMTFGIAGTVIGILGAALAAFALVRKPKANAASPDNTPAESLRG